jgi:hypothetical protein
MSKVTTDVIVTVFLLTYASISVGCTPKVKLLDPRLDEVLVY